MCLRSFLSIGVWGAALIRPLPWNSTGPLAVELWEARGLGVWELRWEAKGSLSRSLDARVLRRSECLACFFSRDRDRDL